MKKGIDFVGVCVVFFCHNGRGDYIFALRGSDCRDEQGTWDIGGGGVEHGDTIEETLRQEIKQEYGTDVLGFEFLGYRDVHRVVDGKASHWVALDFSVLVDAAKVTNGEPHKFARVEWFRLDGLPAPIHSQLPYTLEKYRSRLP